MSTGKHKKKKDVKVRILIIEAICLVLALSIFAFLSFTEKGASFLKGKENKTGEVPKTEPFEPEPEPLPEPEPEPEPEPKPEPVIKTVTLSATGDCAIGRVHVHGYDGSFEAYYDSYGADYFLENVRDIFNSDDLTIVNLECVLSNSTQRVDKTYCIKGAPEYVNIIAGSGVEAASLGNNHNADYGDQSLVDTKNTLDGAGILYALNEKTAIYESPDGIKVGMVSVSLLNTSEQRIQYVYDGIDSLRGQCDIVVCLLHWGVEHTYYPTDFQQQMAHNCRDRGADLIIGNHPHVLQGTELYKGKMICYSLGNFCFGANHNPKDKQTFIYQQTFTFVDDVMQDDKNIRIIPCLLSSHSGYNDYKPMVAEDDAKQGIINNVNKYSEPYGGASFDEEGKLIVN